MRTERHDTKVYWGDWHTYAYCRTCGWIGTRAGLGNASGREGRQAREHERDVDRRIRRALRWRWLTRREPVTHLRSRWGGEPPTCCGRKWDEMYALDAFTDDPDSQTCPGREATP